MQIIFNVLVMIAGFFGGWILNAIWKAVNDLQVTDSKMSDKISGIEVHLAGQYMRRDEVERMVDAIFTKLDRIENKLDAKADK
jgi:diaminopimelate decarboxylase